MNPGTPFAIASDPFSVQAYGAPISRKGLPPAILELQLQLKASIRQAVSGSVVGVAVDGWTNWRHRKTLNFVMLWKQKAIFLKSVPSIFGKSAQVMLDLTKSVVEKAEKEFNVKVAAVVADNENANRALFTKLKEWRNCVMKSLRIT